VPRYIAILEDEQRRLTAMGACVAAACPSHQTISFADASAMIAWLSEHLHEAELISLDHDLPETRAEDGVATDAGTGRMVADWLASQPPTCPVIVHTSNENVAPGMLFVLRDGGWDVRRVYPYEDCAWIAQAWADEARRLLK